jgi:Ca2+-binding RTX toxin-like protein
MRYKGTETADVYLGSAESDFIEGMGGNDTLSGGSGDDTVAGGAGADTIEGGSGDDTLFAEGYASLPLDTFGWPRFKASDTQRARDTLSGGDGSDIIVAGTGDTIDGGTGSVDRLVLNLMHERAGLALDLTLLTSGAEVTLGSTIVRGIEDLVWLRATDHADMIDVGAFGDRHWLVIDAGDGEDTFTARSGHGWIKGGEGADTFDALGFMGELDGGAGDDRIAGGDISRGGAGQDTITATLEAFGGEGDDVITVRAARRDEEPGEAWGEAGDDVLTGSKNVDTLRGGDGADILLGGGGADLLSSAGVMVRGKLLSSDAGTERDRIEGGDGNDSVRIGIGDDADGGAGVDRLFISFAGAAKGMILDSTSLAGGTVRVAGGTITGFEEISGIEGSAFNDRISVGDMTVDGGEGDDRLTAVARGAVVLGGNGDDVVFASGHAGNEYDGGDGSDTIDFSRLSAGIRASVSGMTSTREELGWFETFVGTDHADTLGDNVKDMTIRGGGGDDTITVLTGTDTINGEGGDDRIILNAPTSLSRGDSFNGGAGADQLVANFSVDLSRTVFAAIEWISVKGPLVLAAGQGAGVTRIDSSRLTISSAGTLDLSRATVSADITYLHKDGNRLLIGGGDNTVIGGKSADTIITASGRDALTGGNGDDVLEAGGGADKLTGGAGADRMAGGGGDDRYYAVEAGDTIIERKGGGVDTVETSISYVLGANVDNLILLERALNGTGNAIANTITGTSANNILDGKGGADVLIGGDGNDIYIVDNVGDQVTEYASSGNDLVRAYGSFTLNANIENLEMMSAGTGTGNTMANVITGSAGADVLVGGAGDDRLTGGAGLDRLIGGIGSDYYYVQDGGDVVVEVSGEGMDTVFASADYILGAEIEYLRLTGAARSGTGNALDNTITGSDGDDVLRGMGGLDILQGGVGNDVLYGGAGPDALYGGAGADRFVFEAGDGHPDPYYLDLIAFFSQGEGDRIDLSPLGHLSFIGTAGFSGGGQVRYDTYVEGTLIEIDLNGDRQVDMNIGINSYLTLTAADFILA